MCEFSTVWADWADLGSQKLFSKLTLIFSRKTHDNFQNKIKKQPKLEKVGLPRFQTKKGMLVLIND